MSVNMEGLFLGTKHAIAAMRRNGPQGGSIVNAVSTCALVAPTCASKGAARNLTKSAAWYCGKPGYNIQFNAVHPGCCITPPVEQGASDVLAESGSNDREALLAQRAPDDIAHGVLYLASDESTFTGSDLVVDGGYTA